MSSDFVRVGGDDGIRCCRVSNFIRDIPINVEDFKLTNADSPDIAIGVVIGVRVSNFHVAVFSFPVTFRVITKVPTKD